MPVTSITTASNVTERKRSHGLVPRLLGQGYEPEQLAQRRAWVEDKTGCVLEQVGATTLHGTDLKGNIENPIGAVQMPLGVAGPLAVHGEHAKGTFYVPLATTEGALVRSYERGMVALTRAGGVGVRIYRDENRIAPVFFFDDVETAHDFARTLPEYLDSLRIAAAATTRHGRLLGVEPIPMGREVVVNLSFHTADAHGMNMIAKAAEQVCRWIEKNHRDCRGFYVMSGYSSEKRAAGSLLAGGKGKKVVAGARLPRELVRAFLHLEPKELHRLWQHTVMGHLHTGALGYNGHYANGLTALFIATGQDVANVANSAVGVTWFELLDNGDLFASVTLPSLTVATVGGGTALGTSHECLRMLDCVGSGKAAKFAEIVAATVLAGELSMAGAIGSGEFVEAHESYGRNRPEEPQDTGSEQ